MRFTWAWAPATEDDDPSAEDRSVVRRTFPRRDRHDTPTHRHSHPEGTTDHV